MPLSDIEMIMKGVSNKLEMCSYLKFNDFVHQFKLKYFIVNDFFLVPI